jgi:hypothetical protein
MVLQNHRFYFVPNLVLVANRLSLSRGGIITETDRETPPTRD